jgi:hypothetical protein
VLVKLWSLQTIAFEKIGKWEPEAAVRVQNWRAAGDTEP